MILFIDCYDSFSYNLTHLVSTACSAEVVVIHHDQVSIEEVAKYLPSVEAIILGPGPGHPQNARDRGIIKELWQVLKEKPLPCFGVCFGYQSMVLAFDGQVGRMDPPQHGRVGVIEHNQSSTLFEGVPSPFRAVRYHSLHSTSSSQLVCTAVDSVTTPENPIEMAAEHPSLPFFGVQFHPESVLSSYGLKILQNFWNASLAFNRNNRVIVEGSIPPRLTVSHKPLLQSVKEKKETDTVIQEIKSLDWQALSSLFENKVVLKSAAYPGNWTIIGVLENGITTHIRSKGKNVYEGPLRSPPMSTLPNHDIWQYIADFMSDKIISKEAAARLNKPNLPFLGGLVGYISYEGSCQATIDGGESPVESGLNSDMSFVYITKSVILNEKSKKAYAVGPTTWINTLSSTIETLKSGRSTEGFFESPKLKNLQKVPYSEYEKAISQCFEKLKAGDSYELCLTTQASMEVSDVNAWQLFTHLVEKNPAPYCSYMDFDDVLVATSPERFVSWDHDHCEFRPIKGTVRKSKEMTKAKACEILSTPKEQAENLMIVDLIRHDLGHLLDDVTTPQLMTVEEYHSVYQLVTSVTGKFRHQAGDAASGIDVLSQSLPPGSMTGAPKQRSVEILRTLENKPRGIYSGVHGYWSIHDHGDWSVVIRSLFRNKNDTDSHWKLGAGGAITFLSNARSEYEEVETKMNSILDAFADPFHSE